MSEQQAEYCYFEVGDTVELGNEAYKIKMLDFDINVVFLASLENNEVTWMNIDDLPIDDSDMSIEELLKPIEPPDGDIVGFVYFATNQSGQIVWRHIGQCYDIEELIAINWHHFHRYPIMRRGATPPPNIGEYKRVQRKG